MNWQKLRYRTLVIAGVVVTGTTVYVSTRRHVEAIDVIELLEGLEERQRAVDWSTPPSPSVSTQRVVSWTVNTNGWTYDVPNGTNAPASSNYMEYAGMVDLVTTNDATGLTYTDTYRQDVGRYVWAGWSNLTASTFPTISGVDPNATYTLAGYEDGVGYYTNTGPTTNDVFVLRDVRDRDHAGTESGRGWVLNISTVATNENPWDWTYQIENIPVIFPYFSTTGAVGSFSAQWSFEDGSPSPTGRVVYAGDLSTSETRDAPATVQESRINALTRHLPATNLFYEFDAILTNMIPSFVKAVDPDDGVVFHTVTGLFAALSIGDGTNQFTRTVTNGVPVYGGVGRHVKETNLVERYLILQALTQTVVSADWVHSVVTNAATNVNYAAMEGTGGFDPVETNCADSLPEPWGDANLTNAAGDFVPDYWEEVDIEGNFSQAFFSDLPATFDGTPRGAEWVTTNTDLPGYEYEFQFDFYEREDVVTDTNAAGCWYVTDISRIFGFPGLGDYSSTQLSTNYSSNRITRSTLDEVVFESDLTGVTYNLTYWLQYEDRTNELNSAFFTTGQWFSTFSTTVSDFASIPFTNAAVSNILVGNPVDPVVIGVGTQILFVNSTYDPGPPAVPVSWFAVHQSDQSETNVLRYYGRRVASNAVTVIWSFLRAN